MSLIPINIITVLATLLLPQHEIDDLEDRNHQEEIVFEDDDLEIEVIQEIVFGAEFELLEDLENEGLID